MSVPGWTPELILTCDWCSHPIPGAVDYFDGLPYHRGCVDDAAASDAEEDARRDAACGCHDRLCEQCAHNDQTWGWSL